MLRRSPLPFNFSSTAALSRESSSSRTGLRIAVALLTLIVTTITPATAQFEEDVDFDRPEAWAMKYFASVVMPVTASQLTDPLERGEFRLGVELGLIPHLDTEQRTVGFNGLKEEDLNRSPVSARPQVMIGLGGRSQVSLGLVPPVELDGMKPLVGSLALETRIWQSDRAALAIRPFVMIGKIEGDLTCGEEEAAFAPGSAQNPFGCNAASDDEMKLKNYGIGLVAGKQLGSSRAGTYIAAGITAIFHDPEFQVNAPVFGTVDNTLLLTDGWTTAITAQIGRTFGKTNALVELFYSPLDIQRPGQTSAESDDLLNLRFMLTRAFGKGARR